MFLVLAHPDYPGLKGSKTVVVVVQRQLHSPDIESELDQDSFFDMLSRYQGRRIDDQRCMLHRAVERNSPVTDNKENIDLCG